MIRILRQIFRTGIVTVSTPQVDDPKIRVVGIDLDDTVKKRFRRSLTVREVDAGSCNGCELEIHAINNPIYDCERFGIHFTASPRFADVLLVTGPVARNMEIALQRTYDSVPSPKIVIAVGDCGCNGGIFGETYASAGGVDKIIPVNVYIPGCPPTPADILNGFYKIFL
ncbi:NADH-quinone oxidoreductase subunit B family protein [Candidatus Magnetominusculus xianensis]|uniref:Hydrogenase n=1 Tax=Candidatus Magnetominusculus xianensis TaxID=1748249 RepID=A0ABR5SEV3_9BACT|nr:NADH-quinone oxidoreductase subunit B family protein [Candidatus Magnetominusculus xianensis]KWT83435.1 hydrogenase [Candidatus Magnetominusculus xianensis]MBF0403544.1 NADH-quinone oxidoreductase subunit B family protein [Nitrospirota bacterium]